MACEMEDQALMLAQMTKAQTAAAKATADASDELAEQSLEVAQIASDLSHSQQMRKVAKARMNRIQKIMDCMNAYAKEMGKLTK